MLDEVTKWLAERVITVWTIVTSTIVESENFAFSKNGKGIFFLSIHLLLKNVKPDSTIIRLAKLQSFISLCVFVCDYLHFDFFFKYFTER